MADIQISDNDIYDKLCHLDTNKLPGPDGWHPHFSKKQPLICQNLSQYCFRNPWTRYSS